MQHQSTSGECLGLGAPDIAITYSLGPTTYVEFGAIGLKLETPTVGVSEFVDPAQRSLAIAPGRPNPFVSRTGIDYRVSEAAIVRLRLFDAAGHRVRTLVDREVPAGAHVAWWDGRDDAGRPVPPGVFYARLSSGSTDRSERVVRLR